MMRRREFIAALGSAAMWPLATRAQQPGRTWRIGYLAATPRPTDDVFRETLRKLGYVEDRNLTIFYRWGGSGNYGPLAEDLVRLQVDLIVAVASPATRAAKDATKTIPIVIFGVGDPVAYGFITSLARPGGNITGVSSQMSEIGAKGLQFIKEMIPTAAKLAILGNENNPGNNASVAHLTAAASSMGFKTDVHVLESGDFTTTFTAILRERPDVLYVIPDHFLYTQRARIIDFTLTNRIPAIYGLKEYVVDGGLVAAGPNRDDLARRAAALVDKILKGANPSDLPVEQPTRFELVINLKTAKALGLTVPPSILLRADEVIE
jgi:putative tryptophan/tyrosine transport system substrate-binding protein